MDEEQVSAGARGGGDQQQSESTWRIIPAQTVQQPSVKVRHYLQFSLAIRRTFACKDYVTIQIQRQGDESITIETMMMMFT